MKAFARIANSIEWVITFVVSYFLLQFGADRMSRVITARYIDGNLSNVDGWLTFLGATALVATFCLVHTKTRFFTAAGLGSVLGLSSLSALSSGESQSLMVPNLSLALATMVFLSRSIGKSADYDESDPGLASELLGGRST
jgi:hypothetical protein